MTIRQRAQKTWDDFWAIYKMPPEITRQYVPNFFLSMCKGGDVKLSESALRKLISSKSVRYVCAMNLMHNTYASMYAVPEIKADPMFLEYQHAESAAWLLLHIIDDVAERMVREHTKHGLHDITQYAASIMFDGRKPVLDSLTDTEKEVIDFLALKCRKDLIKLKSLSDFKKPWDEIVESALREDTPRTMQEYRQAKIDVGVYSARFSKFFIAGGADTSYAKKYYGERLKNLSFTSDSIGAAGQCVDGYLDFEADKTEGMRMLKTACGDRSWFLASAVKSCVDVLIKEQVDHIGHFAGFVTYCTKSIIMPHEKKVKSDFVNALIQDALSKDMPLTK